MNWFALIPLVVKLIDLAEKFFGSDRGEVKKQLVMETLQTVAPVTTEISTGGQKETWTQLSNAIDETVAYMYPKNSNEVTQQPSG